MLDDALRGRHSDLFFSATCGGKTPVLLYLLFEHQSTDDPLMAFRLLRYTVRIWDEHLRDHPDAAKLPTILLLVLHHSPGGWTSPTDFHVLLDLDDDTLTANNPADPQELVKQLLAVVGKQEEREIMSIADWYEDRGRQAGLEKGRAEGLKIGARNLLVKLLRTRFGALPEVAAARIQAADAAQLDVWAERVLTASTLDDVLTVG